MQYHLNSSPHKSAPQKSWLSALLLLGCISCHQPARQSSSDDWPVADISPAGFSACGLALQLLEKASKITDLLLACPDNSLYA